MDNNDGRTLEIVRDQLKESLDGIKGTAGLVVAYEPVWAIGTGRAASGTQANGTIKIIRDILATLIGRQAADTTRILYGGSVNAANIAEFIGQPEIGGALVGSASLKAAEFVSIVKQSAAAKG